MSNSSFIFKLILFLSFFTSASAIPNKVLMNENFSDNINDWELFSDNISITKLHRSSYKIINLISTTTEITKKFNIEDKDNFEIKTTLSHQGYRRTDDYSGIIFGAKNLENGYFFGISSQNKFIFYKTVKGKKVHLIAPKKFISKNKNILTIKRVNNITYFLINSKIYGSVEINHLFGDEIGFFVENKLSIIFYSLGVIKTYNDNVKFDNYARLVLNTPKNSTIKILNTKDKYRNNVFFKKRKYHIRVLKKGFNTYNKWITLSNDTTLNINLIATKPILLSNGTIEWSNSNNNFNNNNIYSSDIISNNIQFIANKMFRKIQKDSLKLNLPDKPKKIRYQKLTKDEFETTKYYNNRVYIFKQNIDSRNQDAIKDWKDKILAEKKKYQLRLHNLSNSKQNDYTKCLQKAMHLKYGNPQINTVKYNADKQTFDIELKSTRGNYIKTIYTPVKFQYAKKFKSIVLEKNFMPTIKFQVVNSKLVFSGIEEIQDPEILVEENEYNKAYSIKNDSDSMSELWIFINKYPNSTFKSSAELRISTIKERIRVQEEKQRLYREKRREENRIQEEQRVKERKRKQDSYYARKNIGDKVCMDGTTAIFLQITITAYVERVNGGSIQLRISDTEGTTPNMDGVTLYRNTLIWDDYSDWYKCEY